MHSGGIYSLHYVGIIMIYYCADCDVELTGKNKPFSCNSCAAIKRHKDGVYSRKEVLEKKSISMRKVCSDPDYRAEMSLNRRQEWARGVFDDIFDVAHRKAISEAAAIAGQPERDMLKTDWANENDYDIIRVRERDLNSFGLEEYVECELIPVLSEFVNENVS